MVLTSFSLNLLPLPSAPTTDLAGILYGTSGRAASGNPVLALQTAERDQAKAVAAVAKEPEVKREIAAFRAAVANAKSPAALLADPAARTVLLTANGLGDQADYAALAIKALTSDTAKPGSLASKLSDPRWLGMAKTYDFANKGLSVLNDARVLDGIATGYAEIKWRKTLDANTPGLSNALDFRDRAGKITGALQVLGDKTLREVVTVALGIPKQIAYQSLDAQALAITSRLDLGTFSSAKFVDQFAKRYLVAAAAAAGAADQSGAAATTGLARLFA